MGATAERRQASTRGDARASGGQGPGTLFRSRLVNRIEEAAGLSWVMLEAPAGYGKTTLLGQLSSDHLSSVVPGRTVYVDCTPYGRSGSGPARGVADSGLSADIGRVIGAPGVSRILLDGCSPEWFPSLVRLLTPVNQRTPGKLQVVIACRPGVDPEAFDGLGKGMVLVEDDMSFTEAETEDLVSQITGRTLDGPALAALMEKSRGWPVAIRVVATKLLGAAGAEYVVSALEGGEQHLAAYFRHEVIEKAPEPMREFMLRTSVLPFLDADACREVCTATDPVHGLSYLRRTRTFVEGAEESFSYAPLFRESLLAELRRSDPDLERDLRRTAAAWYDANGRPDLAAGYLREVEDGEGLIRLADRHAATLLTRDQLLSVLDWVQSAPALTPEDVRRALLRRAFVLTMMGEAGLAGQVLQPLSSATLTPSDRVLLEVLRGLWVFTHGEPSMSVAAASRALELLDEVDQELDNPLGMASPEHLRIMATVSIARGEWLGGDFDASRHSLRGVIESHGSAHTASRRALGCLAVQEAWSGRLEAADHYARRLLAGAPGQSLLDRQAIAEANLARACVARDRGDLLGAHRFWKSASAAVADSEPGPTSGLLAAEKAMWCLAAGQPERGLAVVRAYESSGNTPPLVVEQAIYGTAARLCVEVGDLRRAASAIDRALLQAPAQSVGPMRSAMVQLAVVNGRLAEARRILEDWRLFEVDERSALERDLWAAVVELESGRRRQAVRRGCRVVSAAEPEGHLRLFLDGGPAVQRLLRAVAHVSRTAYATSLVQAAVTPDARSGVSILGLSAREQEIIRYLPTPLSSAEIAARLYISVNTLKTHLRTIYRKLGVTGRREAIFQAQRLGMA